MVKEVGTVRETLWCGRIGADHHGHMFKSGDKWYWCPGTEEK